MAPLPKISLVGREIAPVACPASSLRSPARTHATTRRPRRARVPFHPSHGRSRMPLRSSLPSPTTRPATEGGVSVLFPGRVCPAVIQRDPAKNWRSGAPPAEWPGFSGVLRSPRDGLHPPPTAVVNPVPGWTGCGRPHGCTCRPPRLFHPLFFPSGNQPAPNHQA